MKDEEIIAAAKAAGQKTEFGELVRSPLVRGTFSAYEIGFIEGAEWAREQKSAENGKELLYVSNKSYKIGYRDGKRDAEQKQKGGNK